MLVQINGAFFGLGSNVCIKYSQINISITHEPNLCPNNVPSKLIILFFEEPVVDSIHDSTCDSQGTHLLPKGIFPQSREFWKKIICPSLRASNLKHWGLDNHAQAL